MLHIHVTRKLLCDINLKADIVAVPVAEGPRHGTYECGTEYTALFDGGGGIACKRFCRGGVGRKCGRRQLVGETKSAENGRERAPTQMTPNPNYLGPCEYQK
jgi:hypothetical protein